MCSSNTSKYNPNSSQKGSQKTSETILQMIKENPRKTREMLAESAGISSRMVAKYIKKFQE